MSNAFTELQKWCRKHYSFKIVGGPFVQPGDGVFVTLSAAGRKVEIGEYDVPGVEGEANLEQVITEALRRWHSDLSPKRFRLLWWDKQSPPIPVKPWVPGQSWVLEMVAATEADALAVVHSAYWGTGRGPQSLCVWEKGPAVEVPQ